MKLASTELLLNRWHYGLEIHSSAKGLVLRPRLKARTGWTKAFRRPANADDLASVGQVANLFDLNEWEW